MQAFHLSIQEYYAMREVCGGRVRLPDFQWDVWWTNAVLMGVQIGDAFGGRFAEAAGLAAEGPDWRAHVIAALGRAQRGEDALGLFGELQRHGVTHDAGSYSALVCALDESDMPKEALAAFKDMKVEALDPDQASFRAALAAARAASASARAACASASCAS